MLAASATEGTGIILLVQILSAIGGGTAEHSFIHGLTAGFAVLGAPVTEECLLGAFVGLTAIQSTINFAREQASARLQFSFVDDLRGVCFQSLLAAEWRWIAPQRPADLANLMLVEMSRIGVGVQAGLALLATLLLALTYSAAALVIAPGMTAIVVASSGVIFVALGRLQREAYKLGQLQGTANRRLFQAIQDSITGIKLSKILENESYHLALVRATVVQVRRALLSFTRNTSLSRAMFQVAGAGLLALYVYLGFRLLAVPLPELLTLVIIFARLMPLIMSTQQHLNRCINTLPAFSEITTFLAASDAARQPDAGEEARPLPPGGVIELCEVTISYSNRERPALNGLSLSIPAGQITTVMGPSGAGKSTLADVVMGLLTPDDGQLLVGGQPVTGAERRNWIRSIAYMPQEIFLFPGTIRDNLLLAKPDANEATLNEALRRAAAEFVFTLPHGLETVVGQAGGGLSGGERQRITLARALLQNPALLILDEATSALDAANATRVLHAVAALRGTTTVLLIGHSEAAARISDQVLVLRAGELAAAGTWQQVSEHLKGLDG